jgi:hypothetical protein
MLLQNPGVLVIFRFNSISFRRRRSRCALRRALFNLEPAMLLPMPDSLLFVLEHFPVAPEQP